MNIEIPENDRGFQIVHTSRKCSTVIFQNYARVLQMLQDVYTYIHCTHVEHVYVFMCTHVVHVYVCMYNIIHIYIGTSLRS